MAKTVHKKFWGLDCIIRHDYEDAAIQETLKGLQKKSVDYFLHFLTNVPNFQYDSVLDVGCGDDYAVGLLGERFKKSVGIDLYPGAEYNNVIVADWYSMAKKSKEVFGEKNARFNGVFINHSMEHAENVYALMQQVSALQHTGDAIFVAVPDGNTPFGYSITSSTTHFSCITEGYLRTTLQRFGYNVEVTPKCFRPGGEEIWAVGIKQYDGFSLK